MLPFRLVSRSFGSFAAPMRMLQEPHMKPYAMLLLSSARAASTAGVVKTPGGSLEDVKAQVERWDKAHNTYFGPERDLKNFPHPQVVEVSPPARLGFIPDSWFQLFYPKTGVTGPYIFFGGLMTFLLGKEIWVVDHYFPEVMSFALMVWVIQRKWGKPIGEFMSDANDKMVKGVYAEPLEETKKVAQGKIDSMQRYVDQQAEYRRHMYTALKESISLHLEASYRERLVHAHKEVRRRLDYQAEREAVRRRAEQEHMVQWIVGQVKKAVTPQFERDSLASSIANVKLLASKSKASAM